MSDCDSEPFCEEARADRDRLKEELQAAEAVNAKIIESAQAHADENVRLRALLGRALDGLERISMPEDDVDGLCGEVATALGRKPIHVQQLQEPK